MPAFASAWTRLRTRSKYSGLKFVRSNFGLPSVASPGPARSQGSGSTDREIGALAAGSRRVGPGIHGREPLRGIFQHQDPIALLVPGGGDEPTTARVRELADVRPGPLAGVIPLRLHGLAGDLIHVDAQ